MLHALTRLLRRPPGIDPEQLSFELDAPARTPAELLQRLRGLGLRRIDTLTLTRNRAVMVSFRRTELRVHEAYLSAREPVLRAIVQFVEGKTRVQRRAAQRTILAHDVPHAPRRVSPERRRPEDEPLVARLADAHRDYNARFFGGTLQEVRIRVSRRMKSRLGHYTAATPAGDRPEIAIGYAHIRRHGWSEALETLLHEMVHQWQDETGRTIDHGRAFRHKAREVGITASARRPVCSDRPRAFGARRTAGGEREAGAA
ncbi:MAG TPA: SprT-like domain-containing protein [Gemmatimonadaceae bacterium]|nr:SprT-like domain-containing protein [Gemmatimonadaceae bacterium]